MDPSDFQHIFFQTVEILEVILGQEDQILSPNIAITFAVPRLVSHWSLCLHKGCVFGNLERCSIS